MGHDGANFANDTAIYEALENGNYNGEWFIPTRDILQGKDVKGNFVQHDNLAAHKDGRALIGTFVTNSGSGSADWYWSATDYPGNLSEVYILRLSDGVYDWGCKDNDRLSCRPVRAELRPSVA